MTSALHKTLLIAPLNTAQWALGGFYLSLGPTLARSVIGSATPLLGGALMRWACAGWGEAANKAADRIYVAFRLVGHATWRSPRDLRSIFPSNQEDVLLDFLMKANRRYATPQLQDLLRRVYFVP